MKVLTSASTSTARFSPLRFALRELRGGLRGFAIFIACIALGVMAIAGVGSFSRSLTDGLAREGRVILGGDLSFILIHREASAAERAFLARNGDGFRRRHVARDDAQRRRPHALVELKAVDATYPLYGTVKLASGQPLARSHCAARRRLRRGGRSGACSRGSISSLELGSRSAARPSRLPPCSQASPTSSRAASASVRA